MGDAGVGLFAGWVGMLLGVVSGADSGLYQTQIKVMTAFPGMPLYDRLKREGRILSESAWEHAPSSMSISSLTG